MENTEYIKIIKLIKEARRHLKRDDAYRAMRSLEGLEKQIKILYTKPDKKD